jgi:predicted transcriptional regulator
MAQVFKTFNELIDEKRAPGPSPIFSVLHMLHAIDLLAKQAIGRGKLAKELGLGEGAVRTMVRRLKRARLITTSEKGCSLTDDGRQLWNEYKAIFRKKVEIRKNELTLAEKNIAILVKNRGHKVGSGIQQRDAAIRVGAKGAITIKFSKGRMIIPTVSENITEEFPSAAKQILNHLHPEENDAIVIGSADDPLTAEYGSLAAAWTLVND